MKYFLVWEKNDNKIIFSSTDREKTADEYYNKNAELDVEDWGDIEVYSFDILEGKIKKIKEPYKLYH